MEMTEFYLEDLKTKFDKINPNEYYLSYSGGRDSHLLLWFIKEYAKIEGIEIVAFNTGMEHPEILKRMLKYSDRVMIPTKKPMDIKRDHGIPCFTKVQDEAIRRYQTGSRTEYLMSRINDSGEKRSKFAISKKARELVLSDSLHKVSPECCKYLKKLPAKKYEKETKRKAIMGVRGSEGAVRKSQYTSCFTKDKKFTPLHDLTDELMNAIYDQYKIEIPEVYNHIDRTGCMGCPYGVRSGNTIKELELLPENRKKFITEYFKESYEVLGIIK